MKPIIETKGLTHTYGVGTPFEHHALDHVDFSLYAGEFLGLIGHTGSGKSTLIQHLNGLLRPTSGEILFEGENIWKSKAFTRSIRFQVGLVFQYPEYQLFEETVFEDVAFGPKNMGLPQGEVTRRVEEATGCVGIDKSYLDKSPFDRSGGQKRRIAIAGVIAMEPKVLILDEPTAGLDPKARATVLQNILTYQREKNATIVMVSHSMEEMAAYADRILVMNHGKVAMEGTPAHVFSQAKALVEMGLDVPKMTSLFLRLQELGLPVDPTVYTLEQAKEALLSLKGGR